MEDRKQKKRGRKMKKDFKFYCKLFLLTFQISAFTFGGGYVIVTLMQRKFVDELHWIKSEEILDLTAIAQSAPGPIAVNASILIGYRLAGFAGAVVCIFGTVLPPFLILSVISVFYKAFQSNVIVQKVLNGMQAGVAAVIADVVVRMAGELIHTKEKMSILMMAGAAAAVFLLHVNVMILLAACGMTGAGVYLIQSVRERRKKK